MKQAILTILLLITGATAVAKSPPTAPDYSQPAAWAAYPGRSNYMNIRENARLRSAAWH